MKRILIIFALSLSVIAATAQNYVGIEQIGDGWEKKTIKGVKDGSILALTKAFNNVWKTRPTTDLLNNPISNENGDEYEIIVDSQNGYVSAQELGDDGESFSACVWKRSNGHRLFAYVFQRMYGLSINQIILFYDYDPAKGTLTPEPNELCDFVPSSDTDYHPLTFELPQIGKDIVVKEYFMNWFFSIKHVYKWDGMKPVFSKVEIENFDKMKAQYNEIYDGDEDSDFAKYRLYDFDDDNNPELWLSSKNDDYQAIYSIVQGEIQLIDGTYFKTSFIFYDGAICTAGSCGTGCYITQCCLLKDSKPYRRCDELQSYNFEKDSMDKSYSIDGIEVSIEDGTKVYKSLGKSKEIKPDFRPLY